MVRQNDGKEIICDYLRSKNIDFRMDRLLRINNKTVSIDFLLKDRNTIIKYWNTKDTEHIAQRPGYKKNIYERYRETCKDFYEKYEAEGGKIYQIESADRKDLLEKLSVCHGLREG